MTVRVLFFSVLRDIVGEPELSLELPAEARVADLLQTAFLRWPRLADWDQSLLIAVDQTYVKRDAPLHDDAEVAIMPPVQGG
jgi:molybdopterin synthase sulfur carrier subunit